MGFSLLGVLLAWFPNFGYWLDFPAGEEITLS